MDYISKLKKKAYYRKWGRINSGGGENQHFLPQGIMTGVKLKTNKQKTNWDLGKKRLYSE